MMLDNSNRTPLHYAAKYNNNSEVLKILIEKDANFSAFDYSKRTPLHFAASFNNNLEVLKILTA